MSTECVVKSEPENEVPIETNSGTNGTDSPGLQQLEHVQIKTEIDIEPPQLKISVKQEPLYDSEDELPLRPPPLWHRPVSPQPAMVTDVIIKLEPIEEPCNDEDYTTQDNWSQPNTSNYYFNEESLNHNVIHDGKFHCPICQKRFASNSNVQRHILLHNREKFQCPMCHKEFLKRGQFDRHIASHTNERTYECDECDKKFKSSSNLMQHKRSHLTEKPFFCENCHRTFAIKANLLKHQGKSRCKRPIDEPIVCTVCNKTFKKEFLLKSHLRRHTTERPYSCDNCDMTFKYKSTLIRHVQIHNGIRPFECKYCNKTFTHSGLLKPHLRVHTGEKPFQCQICKKMFAHKHNMQRHALRHNVIKHLVCDVCNKKFPKESRLKYHMRTHANEKYFSCDVCPKKFSHRQNVLRHYTRKHPDATYEGTDTDASVALKFWESLVNNKTSEKEEMEFLKMARKMQRTIIIDAQDTAVSTSETPATPKSKAEKQREYRDRIAATRTPAQTIAARKSDAERQRNYRLRKAANLDFVSDSFE